MVIGKLKGMIDAQKEKAQAKKKEKEDAIQAQASEEISQSESLKKEADRLAQLKQYQPAVEEYLKALEVYPYKGTEEDLFQNAKDFLFKTYFNIAACYSYLDNFDDAISHFDKAIAIDIDDDSNKVKALMAKGSSFYRKKLYLEGRYHGAHHIDVEVEEDSSKKKKEDKEDYVTLALDCFAEAAHLEGSYVDAWYNKGHMEYLLGKVKEAVASFDQVIQLKKNYENKENIPLFNEIKREKGISVKLSELFEEEQTERYIKSKTGHFVRNKAECIIADLLFEHGISFQYNMVVSWADKDDFRPTFFIPKLDVYIDHFNTKKMKDSQKAIKLKVKQYDKNKKHHIYTTSKDEKNLAETLRIKLKPYIIL